MAIAQKRDPLLPLNQTLKIVISTEATRVLCEVAEKENLCKTCKRPFHWNNGKETTGREQWEENNGRGQWEENMGRKQREENNRKGTRSRVPQKARRKALPLCRRPEWRRQPIRLIIAVAFFYSSTHLRSEELRFSTAPSAVAGVPLFATASSSLR
jgi:hypothetical protein